MTDRVKGPQFHLSPDCPAEGSLIEWTKQQQRGRLGRATIDQLIVGRSMAQVCPVVADMILASAKRGEEITPDKMIRLLELFSDEPRNEAPQSSVPDAKPEPQQKAMGGFGDLGG